MRFSIATKTRQFPIQSNGRWKCPQCGHKPLFPPVFVQDIFAPGAWQFQAQSLRSRYKYPKQNLAEIDSEGIFRKAGRRRMRSPNPWWATKVDKVLDGSLNIAKSSGNGKSSFGMILGPYDPMIGENRQLVTNEPVEFEK